MRKIGLLLLMYLCCSLFEMKAQITTQNYTYVYVLNLAHVAVNTQWAAESSQLVTGRGASVIFDLDNNKITLKLNFPEKKDVFLIRNKNKNGEGGFEYECTDEKGEDKILVLDARGDKPSEHCVLIMMPDAGVMFAVCNFTKDELILLMQ